MLRATRPRGFTLIELLVAIGVIVALVALSLPAISAIRRRSQGKAVQAFLERVRLATETYSNDFGDYPPSSFKGLGLRGSNGQNEGGECLARCLTTSLKGGPYLELKDSELGNTDDDRLTSDQNPTSSVWNTRELHEIVDFWGNPIVYLHNKDYDKGATVLLATSGGLATVSAGKSEKTGQYEGLTSFQLWSAGPDGQADTDDDIRVWGE